MDKIYYFFVLFQPFFPMPRLMLIPLQAIFGTVFLGWLLARMAFIDIKITTKTEIWFIILFGWIVSIDFINCMLIGSFVELKHVAGRGIFIVIMLTTYHVTQDLSRYMRVLKLLMIGATILAAVTIISVIFHVNPFGAHMGKAPRTFWGVSMPFQRGIGVPMSYGEYGIIMNAVLPIFLISLLQKHFLVRKSFALIAMAILFFAIFLTQSRNAWLSTFLMMSFLLMANVFKSGDVSLKGLRVTGVLLMVALLIIFTSEQLSFLYEGLALGKSAHTFYGRMESNKLAIGLFLEHPLIGAGHEEVTRVIESYRGVSMNVHNAYMDQLASTGLMGFIPFACLIVFTFISMVNMIRSAPPPIDLLALCLGASFVASMFALTAYKGFFCETLAIEYGLFLSLKRLQASAKYRERAWMAKPEFAT
jgi:O-antigen ligase